MPNEDSKFAKIKFLDQFGSEPAFRIDGEDQFKTLCGVLCSMIYIIAILLAFLYYFIYFFYRLNPNLSMVNLTKGKADPIDLGKAGYFVSFVFREEGALKSSADYADTWFKIKANKVSVSISDSSTESPVFTKTPIAVDSCSEVTIDSTRFGGKIDGAIIGNASCLVFPEGFSIEGAETDSKYEFIEIQVQSCDETTPACKSTNINSGATIASSPELANTFNKVRKISLQMNFVEASIDFANYTHPVELSINSDYIFRLDVFKEKRHTFTYKPIIVESKTGILIESTTTISSIGFDSMTSTSTTRDPGERSFGLVDPEATVGRSSDYITILIKASNRQTTFTRTYMKLIDVFSGLGGISAVFIFVFSLLYSWYNQLQMEKLLINRGLLRSSDIEPSSIIYRIEEFNWFEVFRFKYFSMCLSRKMRIRRQQFLLCKEKLTDRTDILSFIKHKASFDVAFEALFLPYQKKMLRTLGAAYSQEDEMIQTDEALSLLRNGQKTEVDKNFDNWLDRNIQQNRGNGEEHNHNLRNRISPN